VSQATGKIAEQAESGENQAGFGAEARREFPGEDKRTWRGRKTGLINPADPSETSTGFGIERHISGNGFPSGRVVNKTRGQVLAGDVTVAWTAEERRRGLIGREGLEPGEALVLPGCRQVHSFGMRFPIDVLFIDKKGTVTAACMCFLPRRVSPITWSSRAAIELHAGTIDRTGTAKGDVVAFEEKVMDARPGAPR
jgi:hypothetical protein